MKLKEYIKFTKGDYLFVLQLEGDSDNFLDLINSFKEKEIEYQIITEQEFLDIVENDGAIQTEIDLW